MTTEPSQLASEYERNVGKLIEEKNLKLEQLKNSQEISLTDIQKLQEEIESLQSLFDNYNLGMNYFRRARGGRSGLRE
jgi:colicin import membrane protein